MFLYRLAVWPMLWLVVGTPVRYLVKTFPAIVTQTCPSKLGRLSQYLEKPSESTSLELGTAGNGSMDSGDDAADDVTDNNDNTATGATETADKCKLHRKVLSRSDMSRKHRSLWYFRTFNPRKLPGGCPPTPEIMKIYVFHRF